MKVEHYTFEHDGLIFKGVSCIFAHGRRFATIFFEGDQSLINDALLDNPDSLLAVWVRDVIGGGKKVVNDPTISLVATQTGAFYGVKSSAELGGHVAVGKLLFRDTHEGGDGGEDGNGN